MMTLYHVDGSKLSWMYIETRHVKEFQDGMKGFLIATKDHMKSSNKQYTYCPCTDQFESLLARVKLKKIFFCTPWH